MSLILINGVNIFILLSMTLSHWTLGKKKEKIKIGEHNYIKKQLWIKTSLYSTHLQSETFRSVVLNIAQVL